MNIQAVAIQSQALAELGVLLSYPTVDTAKQAKDWCQKYGDLCKAASQYIAYFQAEACQLTLSELEELYTRTFDLAAICVPYVTAHLYGDENYERGSLMSQLLARYQEAGFDTKGELPDHLATILRFMPYLNAEEVSELTYFCLLKPVEAMCDSLEGQDNLYLYVLKTLLEMLKLERQYAP